jgi:para-aminobenzoate synthetase component 2
MMIIVIDNYDSFVQNLARYVRLAGAATQVIRHDDMTVDDVLALRPSGIVISPGPCGPAEAGISVDLIRAACTTLPILGVCLGHQCIGAAFGARVVRAKRPMHGRASTLHHDGQGLFAGIENPIAIGRYHSLIVEVGDAAPLQVLARSEEGEVMAMRHKDYPVFGVQFHPESILTEQGQDIMTNFVRMT